MTAALGGDSSTSEVSQGSVDARAEEFARLAHLLDSYWRVPGTNWRFGIDGLAGLLPGVGDVATGVVSAYLVNQARRMGVPTPVLLRMVANVAADVTLGSVPLLGSVFDFAFKANRRNLRLLRRHFEKGGQGDQSGTARGTRPNG